MPGSACNRNRSQYQASPDRHFIWRDEPSHAIHCESDDRRRNDCFPEQQQAQPFACVTQTCKVKCGTDCESDVTQHKAHVGTEIFNRGLVESGPAAVIRVKRAEEDARSNPSGYLRQTNTTNDFTANNA